MSSCLCSRQFFFFQAEDGIRDTSVTGVQTCALPISQLLLMKRRIDDWPFWLAVNSIAVPLYARSEERRVGKECRCRWEQCHEIIKKDSSCHGRSTTCVATGHAKVKRMINKHQ